MTMIHPDLWHLLIGVFAVLVAASLVGYALQRRFSPDGSNQAIENLNERIRAWWVMAVLLAIAFVDDLIRVVSGRPPSYDKPPAATPEEVVERAMESGF